MTKQLLVCLTSMILTTSFVSAQIDIHCHMIPDSYMEAVKAHGMEMDEGFPIPSWGADAHLKFMDEAGIQTSVLTMPAPQPYFGDGERIVRLAEIEIYPNRLEEYLTFAKEVGTVSMATEPGVIGLFSMQDKANACKVYILEVYADREAYQAHLQTAHFKKYKEGSAQMVKSLRLIDTNPMITASLQKSAIR